MSHAPDSSPTAASPSAAPELSAEDAAPLSASYRTAPRVLPIVGLGVVLGIAVAGLCAVLAPGSEDYTRASAFGYFAMLFAIVGGLLGGIAALVLDRLSLKRSQNVRLVRRDEAGAEDE